MKHLIFISCILSFFKVYSQLVTYPACDEIKSKETALNISKHYEVILKQGNLMVKDVVYEVDAKHYTNNSKTNAWINFSMDGEVEVIVKRLNRPISEAYILPKSAEISPEIRANEVRFIISKPGYYSVEFEKGIFIEHPLLIFANPLEIQPPATEDKNVIKFEKGFHDLQEPLIMQDNQTVYLEGGAYVRGQIFGKDLQNVKIKGRGILSGELYPARTGEHMITLRNTKNIEIEGITIIESPRYMIATSGKQHHFHGIKMLGWWFSTDGISGGEYSLIENCFFKVNDDAIKLYKSYTEVRNNVIWQMENGAPFMISWNGSSDFGNIHVHDNEIIRIEHHWDNENLAVICAVHGGKANISNITVENLTIDNSKWRIFHLITKPNRWGTWNPQRGSLSDMTFRNIQYSGIQKIPSLVMGHDEAHPVYNLKFENVNIGNEPLTLGKHIIIDQETTRNVSIKD